MIISSSSVVVAVLLFVEADEALEEVIGRDVGLSVFFGKLWKGNSFGFSICGVCTATISVCVSEESLNPDDVMLLLVVCCICGSCEKTVMQLRMSRIET